MCEKGKIKSKSIRGSLIEAPDVAGGPPSRKRIRDKSFIREKRRRRKEGIRSLGEEEVVGRVVEGGIKYKENKRREDRERRVKEK